MSKFDSSDFLISFYATSSYPSAIRSENSFYPKRETGCVYSTVMIDELVEKLNSGVFNKRSAVLKVLCYISKDIIFQHLPVKEKVKKNEVNSLLNV